MIGLGSVIEGAVLLGLWNDDDEGDGIGGVLSLEMTLHSSSTSLGLLG